MIPKQGQQTAQVLRVSQELLRHGIGGGEAGQEFDDISRQVVALVWRGK